MRFYTNSHPYYCGIDLHARILYVCILDDQDNVLVHEKIPAAPEPLLKLLNPYLGNVVVGVECMHSWYWVSDFCEEHGIDFVLGHALYMKAIHGGKGKNDKIDSFKIAKLLKGGMFPLAYRYPMKLRALRDLMRRRQHVVRHGADMKAHVSNTLSQYNLPAPGHKKDLRYSSAREAVRSAFPDAVAQRNIDLDLALIADCSGSIIKLAQAQQDVLDYMVMFYNSRRLHSYLDYISPNDYESAMAGLDKVA